MPQQSSRGGNDRATSRRLRVLVDLALRELRERFVSLLFLAKCRIQQLHRLVQSEYRGPGLECPVAGDLVMLDRLGRGEEACIESRRAP